MANMPAPNRLIRWLLFALLAAAVGGALLLALLSVDTALSVWQRLQGLPAGFRYVFAALLAAAGLAISWLGWRLLRPRRTPRVVPVSPPVTRAEIERRATHLAELAGVDAGAADELAELDRRADEGEIHVALFGAVNAGKSALVRAMAPGAAATSDVVAGTTRTVAHYRGVLPNGAAFVLADVPGTQEDAARETLARDEALRAHWVLYLCAGDLTRTEAAEVDWLKAFGKPFALVLNQADRYDAAERRQLLSRLGERTSARVIAISAGGRAEVELRDADGHMRREWRELVPDIEALQQLLARRLAPGASAFEPARSAAVLRGIDERLGRVEAEQRARQSELVIAKYTRRAVVGALAAVAPGSDLVIQGALGTGLVRELANIHETPVRQIDIDGLIERAGSTLRTTTAVVLAIAGNAAKAFPGFGTIGGGLAHAVAYGMIFDSLGRAVADTLASGGSLAGEAGEAFALRLKTAPAPRLLGLLETMLRSRSGAAESKETTP